MNSNKDDESDSEMEEMDEVSEINLQMTRKSTDIHGAQSRVLMSHSLANNIEEDDGEGDADTHPHFPKLSAVQANGNKSEYRRVRCPPHRYTPLREHWEQILTPLVEYLKLQVRKYIVIWRLCSSIVLIMLCA
jgi:hypothetical protein